MSKRIAPYASMIDEYISGYLGWISSSIKAAPRTQIRRLAT
jgi:hypothetical protein